MLVLSGGAVVAGKVAYDIGKYALYPLWKPVQFLNTAAQHLDANGFRDAWDEEIRGQSYKEDE
jgi:hypothetical protein